MDGSMRRSKKTNKRLSWWGPLVDMDQISFYQCPYNLTADSDFNSSSHCPVNSFGQPLDFTSDTVTADSSSAYTTID
jgi:hypothetical protein